MKKEYLLFGGASILIGIVIHYCNSLFSIHMEFIHSIGPNILADYHLYLYSVAFFLIGLIFIVLSFLKNK